jgi:hypothetical protein
MLLTPETLAATGTGVKEGKGMSQPLTSKLPSKLLSWLAALLSVAGLIFLTLAVRRSLSGEGA